ncbi:MAG: KH type 1 domain protein [Candidatus Parvarchaeum acidophilus ARMAN-5_'5-way FS']|jgi:exosome complex component RRP4|uniref:Exosome complex component Rrp4 n=1 Tax=Candidatus Parvarchaeum acidophilus ARMAN-5_'5-way FS' TaxID=994838 RepID=F2UU76_PARA5|nr:MAG: KH type 1 domain protein [Candidatus Parvarchaeum acidophilus ARMAN-5_'5-way FS']
MINAKNFDIVTPGELLSDEKNGGNGTYEEENKVYSKFLGMAQVSEKRIDVTPLTGNYYPSEGDDIIGEVTEIASKYWVVDINAPFYTRLDVRDVNFRAELGELDRYIEIGDLIYARVFRIYPNNAADISMRGTRYGKLEPKLTMKIDPVKLPRLIGKEGSMINMIKDQTKCDILVGQNGIIWIDGDEAGRLAAATAIKFIDENYVETDLTEKVGRLLENVRGKV